ncbi:MAG: methyl-accepting chemotaxis protein [Clostridiaceae bacterium]|nr:methyl-accepting chemotaxis protein [Clostridiaceae bacterium]
MRSIRTKIVCYVIALLLVVCIGFAGISYYTASNALLVQVEETLPQLAVQAAKVVENGIEGELNTLGAIASNHVICDANATLEDKLMILNEEVMRSGHLRMGIVDSNGDMKSTNGSSVNIKDSVYFNKAMAGEPYVSDPIISNADNPMIITYAVPIKQNNSIVGVLVAIRGGSSLSNITSEVTFGKSGKAFMLNKSGVTVAHSNIDLVMQMDNDFENVKEDPKLKSLVELEKQMVEGKSGVGEYEYNGTVKYLGYAPVNGSDWSIAIAAPKSEVLAGLNTLKISMLSAAAIFLLISAIVGYIIAKLISTPIVLITDHLKKIAGGDFTHEVPAKCKKLNDEIGVLAKSLETMQESIGELIRGVVSEAGNVNKTVILSSKYMSELNDQIEEVSASTEELSAGMEETAASTEEMNSTSIEIDMAVESIASKAQEGAVSAGEISKRANALRKSFIDSQQGALKILAEVKDKLENALEESKKVEKINELADAILEITSQTNLLALNAAIEAARAGEAGRGFAVVAEEIRKLAENSKNTVNEIQDITKTVIDSVENLSGSSNSLLTFVNTDVVRDYNVMLAATDDYNKDAETVDNLVTDLSATAEELAASIQNMVKAISEITAATNDGANCTSDIAQKTVAVVEMGSEVVKQAHISKNSADKLTELVVNFKV